MTSEKKESISGLTIKVLVIGALLTFFSGAIIGGMGLTATAWHTGPFSAIVHYHIAVRDTHLSWQALSHWSGPAMFAITLMVCGLVNKARSNTFSKQEIVLLAVLIPMGYMIPGNFFGTWPEFTLNAWAFTDARPLIDILFPPWMVPRYADNPELYSTIIDHVNWNPPWGAFTGIIAWNYWHWGSLAFFGIFLGLLLRPLFLDIEDMSIFFVDLEVVMVESTQPKPIGVGGRAWMYFGIGAVFQCVMVLLGHLHDFAFPWMMGDPTAYVPTWGTGGSLWASDIRWCWVSCSTREAILPNVPLHEVWWPYAIAWPYLLSLDILAGWFVGWIATWIIFPITVTSMGLLPEMSPGGRCRDFWQGRLMSYGAINGLFPMLRTGVWFALAIYPVWRARRQFGPILKALWSKVDPEVEAKSPLPYRTIWIGLIATGISASAAMAVLYGYPQFYITKLIIETIEMVGSTRLILETGGLYWAFTGFFGTYSHLDREILDGLIFRALVPGWVPELTRENLWIANVWSDWDWPNNMFYVVPILMWFFIAQSKFGQEAKTSNKSVLKGTIITTIVSLIAVTTFAFLWVNVVPITNPGWQTSSWYAGLPNVASSADELEAGMWPWFRYETGITTYLGQNVAAMAVGFISICLVFIVRGRFPGFPISPTGLALGILPSYYYYVPFIIAIALKWITLKVAGVTFYRDKARPLCVGFIVGMFIGYMILGGILSPINSIRWGLGSGPYP